jgi:hypothetical protein
LPGNKAEIEEGRHSPAFFIGVPRLQLHGGAKETLI